MFCFTITAFQSLKCLIVSFFFYYDMFLNIFLLIKCQNFIFFVALSTWMLWAYVYKLNYVIMWEITNVVVFFFLSFFGGWGKALNHTIQLWLHLISHKCITKNFKYFHYWVPRGKKWELFIRGLKKIHFLLLVLITLTHLTSL